ncbi:MAG: aminofutalosine synthase MqnE, partial [Acidobacteriota bacterium]
MEFSFDTNLNNIADKMSVGERLSFEDGVRLFETSDLSSLGKLADTVRRRKHGAITYFNVNRHFNHTNICVADCKFCGFYRRARQEDAYTRSVEEGVEIARRAVEEGAT